MADWSPAIANEFIRRAVRDGRPLTQMQLQKLVYISHGWNLAINGGPLTTEEPQAWAYGPVYPELWQALRSYGRKPVTEEIRHSDLNPFTGPEPVECSSLGESERALIDRVYKDYGKFPAFQLSALTHKDGTPWSIVYDGGLGKFDTIPSDRIREHFIELARAKQTA